MPHLKIHNKRKQRCSDTYNAENKNGTWWSAFCHPGQLNHNEVIEWSVSPMEDTIQISRPGWQNALHQVPFLSSAL